MRLLRTLAALLCCALGGCAVNQMAFDKKAKTIDVTSKSVVLMTIDVSRPDKSLFEPVPFFVDVGKPDAHSKKDRQTFVLDQDKDTFNTTNAHTLVLARMALDPGKYNLIAVIVSRGFFR